MNLWPSMAICETRWKGIITGDFGTHMLQIIKSQPQEIFTFQQRYGDRGIEGRGIQVKNRANMGK